MSQLALFLSKLHCLFFQIHWLPRLLPLSICHVSLWRVLLSLCSALILRRIYTLRANRQNPVCLWKRAHDESHGVVRAMRWDAFQALPPSAPLENIRSISAVVCWPVWAITPAAALGPLYTLGKNRNVTHCMATLSNLQSQRHMKKLPPGMKHYFSSQWHF